MFQESSSDDTDGVVRVQPTGPSNKWEPSHYRLAVHKYMLAFKRGIIKGPKVRTRASTIPKRKFASNKDTDSDATIIIEQDTEPKKPKIRKTTGRNKKPSKKAKLETFVTKTYVLRKGGTSVSSKKKGESSISSNVLCVL